MKAPRLAKGIIWSMKEFGKMNLDEMAKSIDWPKASVRNEIRRLKDKTILGKFINETEGSKGKCFELEQITRNGGSVDFLYELAKRTFDFDKTIDERI